MASERVEQRVARVAAALDAAGVPYAVIGGNAVRIWVATRDRGAVRATRDVDLLVDPADEARLIAAMQALGFRHEQLRSLTLFVDPADEDRRGGVHIVWAGRRTLPSYSYEAPAVSDRVRAEDEQYWVASLPALLKLKLTSFRLKDQMHIADLVSVGLVDDSVRRQLPTDLLERLRQVEAQQPEWE